MVIQNSAIPATMIPAVRMFYKSGYIISSRKSRLQADADVDLIYFDNWNYAK